MSKRHDPNLGAEVSSSTPPDVSLLLRAHAEQRWLSREVIPVLRQVEQRERLPEEQLPAALAYLEVIWYEAGCRARATDCARSRLSARACAQACARDAQSLDEKLFAKACSYDAAVLRLREVVRRRVTPLIATCAYVDERAHARN